MVAVSQDRSLVDSAELRFRCPSCNVVNDADLFRFKTTEKLYGFLTAKVTYETVVKCPSCETTLQARDSIEDLKLLSNEQASQRFRIRLSFPDKFMVFAGWTTIIFAPVSLVLFVVALIRLPKAASGWRRSSVAGASLAALTTLVITVAVTFQ